MSNNLDILNPQMVDSLCVALSKGCSEKTVKWFSSTFRSWFMKQPHLMVRVLRKRDETLLDLFKVAAVHEIYRRIPYVTSGGWLPAEQTGDDDGDEGEEDEDDEDDEDDCHEDDEDIDDEAPTQFVRKLTLMPRVKDPVHHWTTTVNIGKVLAEPTKLAVKLHEDLSISVTKIASIRSKAKMLDERMKKQVVFMADASLPQWALKKLEEHLPVYKVVPDVAKARLNIPYWEHVRDYCETLPDRQIRHTVEDIDKAVGEWDLALFRQKEIKDLDKGTVLIKEWEDGWKLVHFTDAAAYRAEGSVMKHCIAGYANKSQSAIYSLRLEGRPMFTMEVNRKYKCLVQGRGKCNSAPTEEVLKRIDEWTAEARFSIAEDAFISDQEEADEEPIPIVECDYEEEAECDEEDEDEDEDCDEEPPRRQLGRPGLRDTMSVEELCQCADISSLHGNLSMMSSRYSLMERIRLLTEAANAPGARTSLQRQKKSVYRERAACIQRVIDHRFPTPLPEAPAMPSDAEILQSIQDIQSVQNIYDEDDNI